MPQNFYDYGMASSGSISLWAYIDTSESAYRSIVSDYSVGYGLTIRKQGYDDLETYLLNNNNFGPGIAQDDEGRGYRARNRGVICYPL